MSLAVPSEQLRSSQRPVPLRGRQDLAIQKIDYQGVIHYVVKDPVGLNYHRLRCDQYHLLQLLDGQRSLEEIRDELIRTFPAIQSTLRDVQHLIGDLHQKGLAFGTRTGQAASRIQQRRKKRRQQLWSVLSNILSLRLPGWDPDASLTRMLTVTRWMIHPVSLILASVVVSASWILLMLHIASFQSRLPAFNQFFGWPNLIFLWMTLAGAKIIHEFGHGLICKYFGGECHEMGVMLLVGSPCLYCDVSDSWMLKNKWKRILIGAAGMIIEVFLSAIAIFVWWFTEPGLMHYLALNLIFVTAATTVIFNANPLMRLDGYYMLMDFLEIPNLRQKADKLLSNWMAATFLGVESRPDPFMPQTNRFWFMVFAVASTVYGWVVLFGILTFLYTVLRPYGLQSIGQMLAATSIFGILIRLTMSIYRLATTPRQEPIQRWRLWTTALLLVGMAIGLGMVRIPLFGSAAFVIEPRDVHHVYTKVPGELSELRVRPGSSVQEGDLLATLSDPKLEDRKLELSEQRQLQLKAIQQALALDDPPSRALAEEALQTVDRQIAELTAHMQYLSVVAPVAGTVVAPPRMPSPNLEQRRTHLFGWTDTPLEPRNANCYLEERTHLLSVAPSADVQAILYLDQSHRHDIYVGQSVALKFDHLPRQVFRGRITQIAAAHADIAPDHLSVKHGGLLSTVTDREGKEKLQDAAYQATVILDRVPEDELKSNLRGNARFVTVRRSIFSWVWRSTRRMLHFTL
jgi:putative peptide zinc metalloprotease protein